MFSVLGILAEAPPARRPPSQAQRKRTWFFGLPFDDDVCKWTLTI